MDEPAIIATRPALVLVGEGEPGSLGEAAWQTLILPIGDRKRLPLSGRDRLIEVTGGALRQPNRPVILNVGLAHIQVSPWQQRGSSVANDREERKKVFGMPRWADQHARRDEEPQRVLGVPIDWYGPVDWDWLRSVRHSVGHPIKAYSQWTLRRRLGPYAPDDNGDSESPR
jgi:hypothetical protein